MKLYISRVNKAVDLFIVILFENSLHLGMMLLVNNMRAKKMDDL